MIRTISASLLLGVIAVSSWAGPQSETDQELLVPQEIVLADTATPILGAVETPVLVDDPEETSFMGWIGRSGFLLAALIAMTGILIATHHKSKPAAEQAQQSTQDG